MSEIDIRAAKRPEPDALIQQIADYVCNTEIRSDLALETAHYCLKDSLACALLALKFPECVKLLGPVVPGADLPGGARVPGTHFELDPVQGAFNIGVLVRYLDFNDTWLAAEWGHPSDNLGAILAVADYIARSDVAEGLVPPTVQQILEAMVKAHEIQGVLALKNSFNRVGLDHVLLVRIASTAVVTHMLGGSRDDVVNAVSQAWIDGGALRTYRHAPNTGPRKSWAAGDACRRAVQLALLTLKGEIGYPSALTAKTWGFQDVLFKGNELVLERELDSYVMENVLFKISFPAEFHAQTAVECAMKLHPQVKDRLEQIERIEIETQEAGCRIVDKTGPLDNYAAPDHCTPHMVAYPRRTDRRSLHRPRCRRPAHRCAAQPDDGQGESALHRGVLRRRQARDRQLAAGVLHRWFEHRQDHHRLSGRPPSPPRRGHPAAGAEVRGGGARPLRRAPGRRDPGGHAQAARDRRDGDPRVQRNLVADLSDPERACEART